MLLAARREDGEHRQERKTNLIIIVGEISLEIGCLGLFRMKADKYSFTEIKLHA